MPTYKVVRTVHDMTSDEPHDHHVHDEGHGHVHLSEEDWAAYAAQTERHGEVFLQFLTETISWIDEVRGTAAPTVQHILDIGSGPGVATCELAASYPDAHVTAVDSSPTMLAMATERAARLGVGDRIDIRRAEMPDGVDDLAGVDVIWASMSLHHVGDQVAALGVLRALLRPSGLIAIAEIGGVTRLLTDELDVGRPGFVARLDAVSAAWFIPYSPCDDALQAERRVCTHPML